MQVEQLIFERQLDTQPVIVCTITVITHVITVIVLLNDAYAILKIHCCITKINGSFAINLNWWRIKHYALWQYPRYIQEQMQFLQLKC